MKDKKKKKVDPISRNFKEMIAALEKGYEEYKRFKVDKVMVAAKNSRDCLMVVHKRTKESRQLIQDKKNKRMAMKKSG